MSQKRPETNSDDLKPQQREIEDRKIQDLRALVDKLSEDKDDLDGSEHFSNVNTADGDFKVLKSGSLNSLSEKISNVVNLDRFSAVTVELVVQIQQMLYPTVSSVIKNGLFPESEDSLELSESTEPAKIALKASTLLLETMVEGSDDHRLRREELVDVIVDLTKLIKDRCVIPIVQSNRAGLSETLFKAASGERKELQKVLRLCGGVLARFATLIGKFNLSDRALNSLEYLTLELLVMQNSDHEKDSIFGISKFEHFRQQAMDVLAQLFARHPQQRTSILNGIFSNLEKLPVQKASARQFKSAKEVPIMTISALFMRFVQVAATNRESQFSAGDAEGSDEEAQEDESDETRGAPTKASRRHNTRTQTPVEIASSLTANATQIAGHIAKSLIDRASNVSKTGDKPFRNLLDLFIDDFCNVLGSPEWPAAVLLLHHLLVRMNTILQGDQAAKQSVVDKDMALTTMARIGCGIIDFKNGLRRSKRALDVSQSDLASKLDRLVEEAMEEDRINDSDLFAFDGPYRMVVESLNNYLELGSSSEDPHLQSVKGYHLSSWLAAVVKAYSDKSEDERPQVMKDVQQHLESIILDPKWLSRK